LMVLVEVQTKATEQMINIANSLHVLAEEQKEILHRLTNGMKKEIIDGVKLEMTICNEKLTGELSQVHEMLDSRGDTIKRIDDNINYTKWFVGIVGIVIVIATVILRGLEMRQADLVHQQDYQVIQSLKQILHVEGFTQNKLEE